MKDLDRLVELGLIERYETETTDFPKWNSETVTLYFKNGVSLILEACATYSKNRDGADGILNIDLEE